MTGTRRRDGSACPFCPESVKDKIVAQLQSVLVIEDANPVTNGHMLVLPRRHIEDFFEFTANERAQAHQLLNLMRIKLQDSDPGITGFNVGINCGRSAGQTVMHAHIHLIPRRDGDTPQPRGGVRGVIPERMGY